ncbi:MAG: hypothetical protein HQ567_08895 [Candidatus Nealsonbacteria bacterium]|nr:hypothetical protein [Candidatus Nealsonbacteria bacterium]
MDPEQKYINQRKSYRCQVPEGQEYAELQVGRRRTPIRLFNESAGGFAALVQANVRVKVNDVLGLSTTMGRFEVRVAYVSEVIQASSGKGQEEPLLRIGLDRLDDSSPSARSKPRPNHAKSNLPMTTILAVACVALVIVAVVFGTAALTSGPDGPVRLPDVTNGKLALPGPGGEPAPAQELSEIGLSDAQHRKIQAAAAMAAKTFQELDGQWNDDTPEQRARKQAMVWDTARREILNRLTNEQQKRWEQSVQ